MSSPNIPAPPDPNQAAIAGATADVSNFPFQWIVNSLAQTGGSGTVNGQNLDFTGLGNADQSAQMSDQMAQTLLDIQKNYGSGYIQQRLADLQQSDPAGFAARKQLFDQISQSATANPDRPLASDLQTQIQSSLASAGQLEPEAKSQVAQGVRARQVDRGITLGNSAVNEEATAQVGAADQLRNEQQNTALSYLQSGTSPQDVQYRRIQQALSNLGAFANGQTPEAEFGSLSGAGNGAAPFNPVNYSTPASINPQSGQQGLSFANQLYGQQASNATNQANPWLAGLTLGTQALGTASNFFPSGNNTTFVNTGSAGAFNPFDFSTAPANSTTSGIFDTTSPITTGGQV